MVGDESSGLGYIVHLDIWRRSGDPVVLLLLIGEGNWVTLGWFGSSCSLIRLMYSAIAMLLRLCKTRNLIHSCLNLVSVQICCCMVELNNCHLITLCLTDCDLLYARPFFKSLNNFPICYFIWKMNSLDFLPSLTWSLVTLNKRLKWHWSMWSQTTWFPRSMVG